MEDNKLMIISRCLSPPTENPTEVIYVGKFLESKQILNVIGKDTEKPEHYFYGISRIEKRESELIIHYKATDYEEIKIDSKMGKFGHGIELALNDSAKKSLIKLLQ